MATANIPTLKLDWALTRHIIYTALVVWVVAVRFLGVDPFGLRAALPIAWLFDAISLYVIALVVWHLWPNRPKIA